MYLSLLEHLTHIMSMVNNKVLSWLINFFVLNQDQHFGSTNEEHITVVGSTFKRF